MELKVYNAQGEVVGAVEASDLVWAHPMNMPVLHQVVVAQQANRRQGTHDTKTRGQVIGSGRKLRPQKHTGRARIGDITAPRMRGGGIAHGPHPRSYTQALPKRIRRTALRVALADKLRGKRLFVLDELKLASPDTKAIKGIIDGLKLKGFTLFVTGGVQPAVVTSCRNMPETTVLPAPQLNALDAYRAMNLVLTQDAVKKVDEIWTRPIDRPVRKAPSPGRRPPPFDRLRAPSPRRGERTEKGVVQA